MIVRLPMATRPSVGRKAALSAGQRQRIGLARALYGNPFLVVMDEPNSESRRRGREGALKAAIETVKERGGIAIIVAHRPSALAAVDFVGVIQNGKLAAFGPRNEILTPATTQVALSPASTPAAPAADAAGQSYRSSLQACA